jgi:hypothetical protein
MGKRMVTTLKTLTIPGPADGRHHHRSDVEPGLITDENLASLWILKGACANGVGVHCTP